MNDVLLKIFLSLSCLLIYAPVSLALPPSEDIPEEILRTEIILEGRSLLDSQPLSAAEYAQLQAELAKRGFPPEISPKIRELIFLLNLRHFFKTIVPF
jgi:hypothetical protein